jgi:hypothetical protein
MNNPLQTDYPLLQHAIKSLLCFVLLLVPGVARAQWTTNGNNINNNNSGNVGVGTTTPGAKLDIKAGAAARGTNTDVLVGAGGDSPQVELYGSSTSSAITHDNANGLIFYTNGPTWRQSLFVGHNGYVGVGTVSPLAQFHISNTTGPGVLLSSGSGLGVISVQDTAAPANAKLYQWRSEGGLFRMSLVNDAWSGMVNYNILVANSSGNVGIGTAAPLQKLQIGTNTQSSTATPDSISLGGTYSNTPGANPKLRLFDDNAGTVYGLGVSAFQFDLLAPINGRYVWNFGGVEKMRLDNNGTLGIGTATPNALYKLDVVGSVNTSSGLCIAGDCKTAWSQIASQWTTSGTTINYATGNVGINTASPAEKLDVTGNVKVTGNITVSGNINAKYQDVAEWVETSQQLQPGTVVVLDATRSNQVIASTESYDTRVAGVVSVQPGIALGEAADHRVLVATTGRVKIKVSAKNGAIRIGDLLVTSDQPGVAMKSLPVEIGAVRIHRPGTLIGKALEPLATGTEEILVLLSLQ